MVLEVLASLASYVVSKKLGGSYRDWSDGRFFESLEPAQRGPFLEIVVAAILHDGYQSELEGAWLEHRSEGDEADRALVDAALATVREALAEGADVEAFVAERGAQLADDDQRARTFSIAGYFLLKKSFIVAGRGFPEWEAGLAFGRALGLDEGAIERRLGEAAAAAGPIF